MRKRIYALKYNYLCDLDLYVTCKLANVPYRHPEASKWVKQWRFEFEAVESLLLYQSHNISESKEEESLYLRKKILLRK